MNQRKNNQGAAAPHPVAAPAGIIGDCQAMRMVYTMISQVAVSSATVLIRGGSGTGKELIAREIQQTSDRRDKPFIIVNSAALPETLIESELFGHEKGSFTGAVARRIGRVEAADGGTLFLDEIGDLSITTQVKLLRFLQDRGYQRIGSNDEMTSDVRVIAATSRNLEKLIKEGNFREDLYYRLNVFPIRLPDLAERRSDIPLLTMHFLNQFNQKYNRKIKRISAAAMNVITTYGWPGNVRELENCMERAVLTSGGESIELNDLPPGIRQLPTEPDVMDFTGDFTAKVAAFERRLIVGALKETGNNVAAAARLLNITPRIIHYKIKNLNIEVK